jgi:hypothetical protein
LVTDIGCQKNTKIDKIVNFLLKGLQINFVAKEKWTFSKISWVSKDKKRKRERSITEKISFPIKLLT